VFERYAAVLGPAIFAWMAAIGHGREAILSLILFFGAGMFLLGRVDIAAGQRAARATETATLDS
jgi:UMF1 family MFS transporter